MCITNWRGDPGTGGAGFGGVKQEVKNHTFDTSSDRFLEELHDALTDIRALVLGRPPSS